MLPILLSLEAQNSFNKCQLADFIILYFGFKNQAIARQNMLKVLQSMKTPFFQFSGHAALRIRTFTF